jgi:hypothetical protein
MAPGPNEDCERETRTDATVITTSPRLQSTTTASTTMTANITHVVRRATIPIASLAAAVYSIYDWHARALLAVVRDPLPHTLPFASRCRLVKCLSLSGARLAGASSMGRAGFEPATLGLKVDPAGFVCSRVSRQGGMVEPNRLTCQRVLLGHAVDPTLTPPSSPQATSSELNRLIQCSHRPLFTMPAVMTARARLRFASTNLTQSA